MNISTLRDTILQNLKNDKAFDGMVTVNMNGYFFSAADIALPVEGDEPDVYRIAVVKHGAKEKPLSVFERKRLCSDCRRNGGLLPSGMRADS